MTRRRRGSIAATDAYVRGELRRALFGHHARDPEFCAALEALWVQHHDGVPRGDEWHLASADDEVLGRLLGPRTAPMRAYLTAVENVAGRFGLDRLEGGAGLETIHEWCRERQEVGPGWPASNFGEGYQEYGPVVTVGETVVRPLGTLTIGDQRLTLSEADVVPILRVGDGRDAWDPTRERRTPARDRLRHSFGSRAARRQIDAEQNRLEGLAADVGATSRASRPNAKRDVGWLFECIRHNKTPGDIAEAADWKTEPAAVKQAVRRVAEDAGVNLRGTRWGSQRW